MKPEDIAGIKRNADVLAEWMITKCHCDPDQACSWCIHAAMAQYIGELCKREALGVETEEVKPSLLGLADALARDIQAEREATWDADVRPDDEEIVVKAAVAVTATNLSLEAYQVAREPEPSPKVTADERRGESLKVIGNARPLLEALASIRNIVQDEQIPGTLQIFEICGEALSSYCLVEVTAYGFALCGHLIPCPDHPGQPKEGER